MLAPDRDVASRTSHARGRRRPLVSTLLGALAGLVGLIGLAACTSPAPQVRTLTVIATGVGTVNVNGTDRSLPWSGQLVRGTTVTLLARPAAGYAFSAWEAGVVGASNPFSFQLDADTTVRASFAQLPAIVVTPASRSFGAVELGTSSEMTFTVANAGGGTLVGVAGTDAPFDVVSGATYHLGPGAASEVRVRFGPTATGLATAAVVFTGGGGASVTVTGAGVAAPPPRRLLEVTTSGAGRVASDPAGIDCPSECAAEFSDGTEVVLAAVPAAGHSAGWTGCDSIPADNTCIVDMGSARNVTATFTADPIVSVGITPATVTLFGGDSQTFSASVAGTTDRRVTWTTTGGTIAGSGTTVTYTAPSVGGSYTVTVTSVADTTKSASATVLVDERRVVSLAAGDAHSLALKNDGTVWAWGSNASGQLGDGTTINRNSPVQVLSLFGIVRIAAGGSHSLAVRSDGAVFAWGSNQYGQLGTGSGTYSSVPVKPLFSNDRIIDVAAGTDHSVALSATGLVWTWGLNRDAQLGDGTTADHEYPVPLQLTAIRAIGTGSDHNLAISSDGTVFAWGYNPFQQTGSPSDGCGLRAGCVLSPTRVDNFRVGAGTAGGGDSSTFVVTTDGNIYTWGQNSLGQMGTASSDECYLRGSPIPFMCSLRPLQVAGLSGVQQADSRTRHTVAVANGGDVYTWGLNSSGQLGVESHDACSVLGAPEMACSRTPLRVGAVAGVIGVAAGGTHSLAVTNNGTVWAWGGNDAGQLGDGTNATRNRPVVVRVP